MQNNGPKVLAFAGSIRSESVNEKLLQLACHLAIPQGISVTHLRLAEYPLPIFDEDLERQEFPENAVRLKELFKQHDSLLLACPEYNSSITPLLKNVIDWVSRPSGDATPLEAFRGKTACLLSASPGGLGGLRGLRHVREILSNIQVLVVPQQFALSSAANAFDSQGSLIDANQQNSLQQCVTNFLTTVRQLYSGKTK